MGEFNIAKLIRFMIIGFILITVLRACTASTFGGYGSGGHYYGPGMGGGGGGFFTGMLLGNMMGGGGSVFSGGNNRDRNVRRGSVGSSSGSRGGGFGFGK